MIMQRKRSFEQAQAQAHTQISSDRLGAVDACWRAANYLGVAQLYLTDNALLRRPLRPEDIKPHLQGGWGTQPGLNMVYVHLNRLIQDTDANVMLVVGPGHAAPAILANLFLEGTLCEQSSHLDLDEAGVNELARQFGWPDGVPPYLSADTPGMIQRGTKVGASLSRATGAAFDNPDLVVACVIGDDEAETGPLATSWALNRFLNPVRDGAVLPILHLGGYRAAGPSILGRMDNDELDNFFTGYGYEIGIVAGDDPRKTHEAMWQAMDWALSEIRELQEQARTGGAMERPVWPMLILRTPTGWTCPHEVEGQLVEGASRAHGLPVPNPRYNPEHLRVLEQWLRNYGPTNLFDATGRPAPEVASICPKGDRRIGRNRQANGGELRVDLKLPDPRGHAVAVTSPGAARAEGLEVAAGYLRDVLRENEASRNVRLFCPDETIVRRMSAVLEATPRAWMWPIVGTDEHLSFEGRALEVGCERTLEGWLEGYVATGRHGLLVCREEALAGGQAMVEEFGRWVEEAGRTGWRKPLASLNVLAAREPGGQGVLPAGLIAGGEVVHVYLPPDANSLVCTIEQCLRSVGRINVVVASGGVLPQWLSTVAAREHCGRGASRWDWAAGRGEEALEVVLAAAGDLETVEVLAAAQVLRREVEDLRFRVVNVTDLSALRGGGGEGRGMDEAAFASLFGLETPVVFAAHGAAMAVRELLRDRPNPARFRVHGEGNAVRAITAFDRLAQDGQSRFHLAMAAIEAAGRAAAGAELLGRLRGKLTQQHQHMRQRGQDMPEVGRWQWL